MKQEKAKKLKTLVAGTVLAMGVSIPYHVMAETNIVPISAEVAEVQQVPLRYVAESIGAQVEWDAEKGQATAYRGEQYFTVKPGEVAANVNGTVITMPEAAQWAGSSVTVPIDVIKQAFDASISWSSSTGVIINYNDIVSLTGFILNHAITGNLSVAGSFMSSQLGAVMPPDDVLVTLTELSQVLGQPDKLVSVSTANNGVHHNVTYTYLTDQEMPMMLTFRYDQQFKINDLYFPYSAVTNGLYEAPEYDNPSAYTEKEVVIGEGAFQLPGTLTIPEGEGPFPVVVLVHGSGANDRDEAVGAYAPFRDLAVGLAAQDIAVLRYEKRTREYQFQTYYDNEFTVGKESVDDALAAVSYLTKEEAIDPDQIFVVGHSQGGMVMPRIVDGDEGAIAGAVVISSPFEPLEDIISWQLEQQLALMSESGLPPEQIAVMEEQKGAWDQLYGLLKDESIGVEQLQQVFGPSNGNWWADFRNYYAAEDAKDQTGPLLIIQGENDIQVHLDQLQGWKDALVDRDDVEYLQYPKMNHFLVEVDQPSTGAEYEVPGNVSPQLINDLAEWVKNIAGQSQN